MQNPEVQNPSILEAKALEEDYRRMARDVEHERGAEEWCEGLIVDVTCGTEEHL